MNVKKFQSLGFSANCYALEIGEEVALIDVGEATSEILSYIAEKGDSIKYILLTHNHFDHICGVEKVSELTRAKLAIHEQDGKNLANPLYNLTDKVGLPNPNLSADILLKDGDELPLGDSKIKVIHTPGHTLGGACFVVDDVLFSGDTLFCSTVGRTDFIGGDMRVLLCSLKKLSALGGNYKVYPGHEQSTTLEQEIKTNPYFRM